MEGDDLQHGVLLAAVHRGQVIQRHPHGPVGPLRELAGEGLARPQELPLQDVSENLQGRYVSLACTELPAAQTGEHALHPRVLAHMNSYTGPRTLSRPCRHSHPPAHASLPLPSALLPQCLSPGLSYGRGTPNPRVLKAP